ncbi:hypothetical protein [Geminocystis sp. NIES-3709]|uniref:hypothetical protein n=1 Tax=Geminocystis sp. NIES-3709 TaxID=1617448 RepID=UPI0005FC8FC9|nr:hypothetical protein [Geminocystis sp. NIES-3709]BAQ65466.1 hypothetical protein GM3709_2231 [Geminocystis sp. NIES-3709]
MIKSTAIKHKTHNKFFVLTLALTTGLVSFAPFQVSAKPYQEFGYNQTTFNQTKQNKNSRFYRSNNGFNNSSNSVVQAQNVTLSSGTLIPTTYSSANKILVTKEETMALVLTVTTSIRDNSNQVIIPSGSRIVGEIRPSGNGSRFVGDTLILSNGDEYDINAVSRVITTTETVSAGRNTDAIWQGSLAGAGAAAIISGVTGDRRITPLEILGGASAGALGGLLLGGNRSQELISINPQQDLQLTLTSNFRMN